MVVSAVIKNCELFLSQKSLNRSWRAMQSQKCASDAWELAADATDFIDPNCAIKENSLERLQKSKK